MQQAFHRVLGIPFPGPAWCNLVPLLATVGVALMQTLARMHVQMDMLKNEDKSFCYFAFFFLPES